MLFGILGTRLLGLRRTRLHTLGLHPLQLETFILQRHQLVHGLLKTNTLVHILGLTGAFLPQAWLVNAPRRRGLWWLVRWLKPLRPQRRTRLKILVLLSRRKWLYNQLRQVVLSRSLRLNSQRLRNLLWSGRKRLYNQLRQTILSHSLRSGSERLQSLLRITTWL